MPKQPQIMTQLERQSGMGRPGGMMSKGSTSAPGGKGKTFAAMENALLKGGAKSPKKVAAGKPGRQFRTQYSGESMK